MRDEARAKLNRAAVAAQDGACNPRALLNAAYEGSKEFDSFDDMREDPAMRLIVHQLAFLFRIDNFDNLDYYEKIMAKVKGTHNV